jgi:hypothetical protein
MKAFFALKNWKRKGMSCAVLGCCTFFACTSNGSDTVIVPSAPASTIIAAAIPDSIQTKMENYIPIYEGSTPPVITGTYVITPMMLVYATDAANAADSVRDTYIRFSDQNTITNRAVYDEKEGTDTAHSNDVLVIGSGNNFTAYFVSTGTSSGIYVKTTTVISGTKTASGISGLRYAFVMVDKGADPNDTLVAVGTFRVFKDNDGLAANAVWPTALLLKTSAASALSNESRSFLSNERM